MMDLSAIFYLKCTLMACWMKSTVINIPKSSSAILVNLLIIEEALNIARRISIKAVQIQTLQKINESKFKLFELEKDITV